MTQPKTAAMADIVTSNPLAAESTKVLAEGVEALLAASTECQSELMDFVTMRLEKDRTVAQEVINCKSVVDAMKVQADWAGETIRDYNDEMARMLSIFTKHSPSGVETKQKRS